MNRFVAPRRGACDRFRGARRAYAIEPVVLEPLELRLLFAAAVITGVSPIQNSHTAAISMDITSIYDQNIDTGGSVTDATFVVHAMQTGQIVDPPHGNAISVVGDTITFDPDNDFKTGETIQVIATDGILNTLSEPSVNRVWEFRAATSGGSGDFVDSGQELGDHNSRGVALGDVDGDLDAFVVNLDQGDRVWRNDGSARSPTAVRVWAITPDWSCLSVILTATATWTRSWPVICSQLRVDQRRVGQLQR